MTLPQVVLDTDILSAVMRKNSAAVAKARSYLVRHRQFTFSIITRYEILRGLKAKAALKQSQAFDRLCMQSRILPLTDEMIVKASEVYADLHQRGELIGDADILIAASALVLGVVTNNENHFRRVPNLHVENWPK